MPLTKTCPYRAAGGAFPPRRKRCARNSGVVIAYHPRGRFRPQNRFATGPGPLYLVYLVPKTGIKVSEDVANTIFIDLGQIKSFEGSQKYAVTDGVNLKDYKTVVIWCKEFFFLISPAELSFL